MTHNSVNGVLGRILEEDGSHGRAAISISGDAIAGVRRTDSPDSPEGLLRLPEEFTVVPGFVDLHCHGGFGVDFPTSDAAGAREAVSRIHRTGTTTLLASLVTAEPQALLDGAERFAGLAESGAIAGIHLEGPFLSHARCGAQNPDWLINPDLDLVRGLAAAARGALRTMTFAPELPGSAELVDVLASLGVVPSVGHTAASPEVAREALARAARELARHETGPGAVPTVTHLFNGMDPVHHRSPGALSACLRAARAGHAVVELIADNVHLAPDTVAMVFELVGADNIALVTDSMAAAGLSDGTYSLGPSQVQVSGGVARLKAGGSIAGGTSTMASLVRNAVDAGVPLKDALHSATHVPARVLGLDGQAGVLKEGARADLVVLDERLEVRGVMRGGQWLSTPR
ncbi:amidohydrolase family protein [Arthrobacter sp. 35/47]|uniref:N-acetylglucosamine-6-phosphate deacetylase n=1 Tax=Arthrobacter sp. 35/47 TaxID=269454 RepID=UPI0004B1CDE6|nr:amidohydrolase family protein [Arthrobacter sp. 35/47]